MLLQHILTLGNCPVQYKTSIGGTKGLHICLSTNGTHGIVGVQEKIMQSFIRNSVPVIFMITLGSI